MVPEGSASLRHQRQGATETLLARVLKRIHAATGNPAEITGGNVIETSGTARPTPGCAVVGATADRAEATAREVVLTAKDESGYNSNYHQPHSVVIRPFHATPTFPALKIIYRISRNTLAVFGKSVASRLAAGKTYF